MPATPNNRIEQTAVRMKLMRMTLHSEVDAMNRQMYCSVYGMIRQNPDQIESLLHLLSASRHFERIADHATNIAEDVIYMVEGRVVRRKPEEYPTGESCQ